MSVDANAYNLVDWYENSNDPLIKDITISMIEAGSLFQDIPLATSAQAKQMGMRITDSLPSPTYRPLNDPPTAFTAKQAPYEEEAHFIRDSVLVDDFYKREKNTIQDPFSLRIMQYMKGLAFDLNDKLINNDKAASTGDPNCFSGIKKRLADTKRCNPDCSFQTAADLSGTITAANANIILEDMDRLLAEVDSVDGSGVTLVTNPIVIRKLATAIRTLGAGAGFDTTVDNFGRRVLKFRNATIRDAGRKAPGSGGTQQTYIVSNLENQAGTANTGGTYSSLYAIKYGMQDFGGWQTSSPSFSPPYRTDDYVIWKSVFDWGVGLWQPSTRALGRINGIKLS